MIQTNSLQHQPNACPLCLVCLICTKIYGENNTCPSKELKWKRKSDGYKINFRHESLDKVAVRSVSRYFISLNTKILGLPHRDRRFFAHP